MTDITPQEAAAEIVRRKRASESLHEFARQAWPIIEGGRQFVDGWHIRAICEHLEAVHRGELSNLLINMPPRFMKSGLIAVMYPAWEWIHKPDTQFLFASYAEKLSIRDNVKCRRVIESQWYQSRWGRRFQLVGDSNTKLRFDNDKTGYRLATSVDGTNTGEGGDVIVYDDPNSARDCSETVLDSTINWFDQTMSSRLNDPKTGRRILVQQRLNEKDLTGHILDIEPEDWAKLILPLEFEPARRVYTIKLPSTGGKLWTDPRQADGELLWPERFGPEETARLKRRLGSEYAVAGQLQQRPAPADGGIIKKGWFQWWKQELPSKLDFTLASWDTALTEKKNNAHSACTVWGVFKDDHGVSNVILLNTWRGKLEFPDLRRKIVDIANDYRNEDGKTRPDGHHRPDLILIEAKANGLSLIQDLSRADIIATPFDPSRFGDKTERVRKCTDILEGNRVWVPARPPAFTALRTYADFMVAQAVLFPAGTSRDLVDTMAQALLRLKFTGWVHNPADPDPPVPRERDEKGAFY